MVATPPVRPGPATLVSLAAGLVIALRELDGLVGQVLDAGRSWSPTGLTGPGSFADRDGWAFLAAAQADPSLRMEDWLHLYAWLDLVFVGVYATMLLWWARSLADGATGSRARALAVAQGAVLVGAVADVVESVAILRLSPSSLPAGWVSNVKWGGLVVGVVILLVLTGTVLLRVARRVLVALYTHRYSVIIVAPLALLGLGAGTDILEQVPDIQRRWADDGPGDVLAAGAITLFLAVAAFAMGRQRTHHIWRRTTDELPTPDDPRSPLLLWFAGPAMLSVAALVALFADAHVSWPRFAVFAGIPIAVGGLSLFLRHRWTTTELRPRRGLVSLEQLPVTALVGDVLPGLLLVVAGLGAIRSFTAVVALGDAPWGAVVLFGAGWLTIAVTWWAQSLLCDRLATASGVGGDEGDEPPDLSGVRGRLVALLTPGLTPTTPAAPVGAGASVTSLRTSWVAWTTLTVSTLTGLALAVAPTWAADHLGVIATFQLAVGSLSLLIASTVVIAQVSGSPEAFWRLGVPYTPTTTIVVLACLAAALLGGSADVHPLRSPDTDAAEAAGGIAPDERPDLATLLPQWLAADPTGACATDLGDGLKARPLLMYAAEGGGIRAAYWTTSGIDRIAAGGPAACRSAVVSSGASGGALGLAMSSVAPPGGARDAVLEITGPDALTEAVDGMVLRDNVYAATGVPLPGFGGGREPFEWTDRAGLIEQSWERAVPGLEQPWLRERTGWDWGPSGPLVLNSTSATTGCRALVSQVDLGDLATSGCGGKITVAGSTDVLACTERLRTSTAALLASRFPFVTPAAAQSCGGVDQQYVDGGYAENTGVGTLVDLAPQVMSWVRRHNTCVLSTPAAGDCDGQATTLVVPLLVYFDNGTGSDLAAAAPEPGLQILVPLVTFLRARATLYSPDSMLQRATRTFGTTQLWGPDRPDVEALVNAWRTRPVYVVYQATRPGIAAPLGWVLSSASRKPMDAALSEQQEPVEELRYGTLDELIDDLTP